MKAVGTNTAASTRAMATTAPPYLVHGLVGRLARGEPQRDVPLHVLDHHDGIVHHDADGEHHAEEGQRVEREAERAHDREGAHERNRDRDDGDQRRAPGLQEDDHHQHDEEHGFEEGGVDRAHALGDELGGIVDDLEVDAGRELRLEALHGADDLRRGAERVGARPLEDRQRHGGLAVEIGIRDVILRAELHAGHVQEAHQPPVRGRPHDDVAELARVLEAPLRFHDELEGVVARRRLGPKRAARHLDVLLLNGADHVAGCHPEGGELFRIEPDAQGILPLAEDDQQVADAIEAQQDVRDVVAGVVRHVELVVALVRREHVHRPS
jgi:hypothetical protein